MFMEDGKFQEYYRQIRERDERIANEKSLPNVEGTNVFTIFGLSLGITSIIFSFFTRYSIVFVLLALLLSFIGRRKKKNNIADAGVICSGIDYGDYFHRIQVCCSKIGEWILEEFFGLNTKIVI